MCVRFRNQTLIFYNLVGPQAQITQTSNDWYFTSQTYSNYLQNWVGSQIMARISFRDRFINFLAPRRRHTFFQSIHKKSYFGLSFNKPSLNNLRHVYLRHSPGVWAERPGHRNRPRLSAMVPITISWILLSRQAIVRSLIRKQDNPYDNARRAAQELSILRNSRTPSGPYHITYYSQQLC